MSGAGALSPNGNSPLCVVDVIISLTVCLIVYVGGFGMTYLSGHYPKKCKLVLDITRELAGYLALTGRA